MAFELDHVFIVDESPEEALGAAMQKQDASRATGDERGRALGLIKAADALTLLDKPDEAMGQVTEALAMCSDMKFEEGRAAAMNVMTKIHVKRGRDEEELEEALDSATDTLKLCRKLGFRKGEAVALTTLASVYHASKKATPAIKHAKEALAIFAELGEKRAMAEVYHAVMGAYLIKAPPETFLATKQISKAMAIYQELGDKSKEAASMHTIATVEKQAGDIKKAAEALQKAKDLFTEAGDIKGQATVMETMMDMLVDGGLYAEALKVGKQRAALCRDGGDAQGEGRALLKLGDAMMRSDDHEKAGRVAEAAMGVFAGVNDMAGLQSAKELLDGAKHGRAVEEIEASLSKVAETMHVPRTLVVDPGLNKRVSASWGSAITA